MAVLKIDHYNLRAERDLLEALKNFYVDVVGLYVGKRPSFRSFGYWLYAGEKDVLHLSESRQNEHRDISQSTTFDHVAFSCSDLNDHLQRLSEHSIEYSQSQVPGTGHIQIFLTDPAGNGIELNFHGGEE